ncbi:MAG: hotdog fold thioesterase [Bacteroidia bacterium]|nr:hotdog fold thioesterase [Bacteroidia bacterium]MCZ2248890.1 hotdog fold thioesterase [Bacteroidia bacterium]
MIWFQKIELDKLENIGKNTLSSNLGIEIIDIGEDFIKARMPVDERTKQPYGILHGGASVALAETIGSYGSHLVIDSSKFFSVGLEINANHIRKVSQGYVYGVAKPLHLGKSTHVWSIEITDEENKLVCISRITIAIVSKI